MGTVEGVEGGGKEKEGVVAKGGEREREEGKEE
jgi:hypothetical protein